MSNHSQQEKNKKVRVNIKARLIDKRTQEEHKDYEVALDTTNLVIKSLKDLESLRLPLNFKINPKSLIEGGASTNNERRNITDTDKFSVKSYETGSIDANTRPETSTAFTSLNMSQNTRFNNESKPPITDIHDDDTSPKRTIGHVSIQEHPNISEYIMENQSANPSSIFQSNILDESRGYVPLFNQTTPTTSQYYDPSVANNATQGRSKRFILKIPAIPAGDTNKKVIRTKITFNLKNLLRNSTLGSDEISRKFVNFSESDVEPIKKASKHVMTVSSDVVLVEGEEASTKSQRNDEGNNVKKESPLEAKICKICAIDESIEDHQLRNLVPVVFHEDKDAVQFPKIREGSIQMGVNSLVDINNAILMDESLDVENDVREIVSPDMVVLEPSYTKLAVFEGSKHILSETQEADSPVLTDSEIPQTPFFSLNEITCRELNSKESLQQVSGDELQSDEVVKQETKTLTSKEVQSMLAFLASSSKTVIDEILRKVQVKDDNNSATSIDDSEELTESEVSQSPKESFESTSPDEPRTDEANKQKNLSVEEIQLTPSQSKLSLIDSSKQINAIKSETQVKAAKIVTQDPTVSLLNDISFPDIKSLEDFDQISVPTNELQFDELEKQERLTMSSIQFEPSQSKLGFFDSLQVDDDDTNTSIDDNVAQPKSKLSIFPTLVPFAPRDDTTFPVHTRSFFILKESFDQIPADKIMESGPFKSKLSFHGSSNPIVDRALSETEVKEGSGQTLSDKIYTVHSSLLRLADAIENSMKVIAETKFKAVSLESTGMSPDEKDMPSSTKERHSVSFMKDEKVPQLLHSTPVQSHVKGINITDLSHIIGTEDAAIIESIIKVAEIWNNLKNRIIVERQNKVKSYDNILTENELVTTFAGIVKEIIGMPSEVKAALLMKETLQDMSSESLRQDISSTETLIDSVFSSSGERTNIENDPDIRSLRRISNELQDAIKHENKIHSQSSTIRRSSNKSTLNLLHLSKESIVETPESANSSSLRKNMQGLSLSDSQLKILADIIAKNLRSRRSISDVPSNTSTRSSRMERGIKELKQGLQDMKDNIHKILTTPHNSYEEEVIVTHEQMVDNVAVPKQIITESIEQARHIVKELEERHLVNQRQSSSDLDENRTGKSNK